MKVMAIVLLAAATLAGCGGSGGQPAGSVKVTMTEFQFDPSNISVAGGKVVFYLVNSGTVSHDMVILDSTGTRVAGSDMVSAGEASVFTINNLPPGTYMFVCDLPGHEASGMKGTLTTT